jgi:predicted lipase
MAYCKKEQISAWKCEDCGRWKFFGRYEANSGKSTQSVVVGDAAKNNIYVSFRGTMGTVKQWMADLDFKWKSWSDCSGCKVHNGFYSIHQMVRDGTLANLKKAVAAMPRADIYITGHSMGGAIATLFSMYLHVHHPTMAPTQLYDIGCPRLGNSAFGSKLDEYFKDNHYRIKNQKDLVPDVPLRAMGYRHTGT